MHKCFYCGEPVKKFIFDRQVQPKLEKLLIESGIDHGDRLRIQKRSNGRCRKCRLVQSTNIPDQLLLDQMYNMFSIADVSDQLSGYFPSQTAIEHVKTNVFSRRISLMERLIDKFVSNVSHVAMLRYQDGSILEFFHDTYGSKLWGWEPISSWNNFCDSRLTIFDMPLSFRGRLREETSAGSPVPKFDVLVCFHTLLHSVNPQSDLDFLKKLVKDGGLIIFMDEIMVKRKNPFHMTHPNESQFISLLVKNFASISRIPGAGNPERHIIENTLGSDNPDFWCLLD